MTPMNRKEREAYCKQLGIRIRNGGQLTLEEQQDLKRLSLEFPDGNFATKNFCPAKKTPDES